jgi:hypothetical protein
MALNGFILAALTAVAALACGITWQIRRRNLQCWIGAHLRQEAARRIRRTPKSPNGVDVLICIVDHFEPHAGGASDAVADARVAAWVDRYAELFGGFRDSDARPPRHTFFYPIDQYAPRHVDALAALCRDGYGEIEIHLHHDHDTADNLDRTLRRFTQLFAARHGLLGRRRADGRLMYGFVHGNWALDNARSDGRWCGVDNELAVLHRTGCYADFTLPSAPDVTQTRKINSIYYAVGRPGRCKSHDGGVDVRVGLAPSADGLMLIQGPLSLYRTRGQWVPRVENGCLQRSQPPTEARLEQWLRAQIHVAGRPDWRFVKLHTHGATEANQSVLLGESMLNFHRSLARRAAADGGFRFHYVTAREIYNLAKAAEAGWQGPVNEAREFEIAPPSLPDADMAPAHSAWPSESLRPAAL